MESARFGGPMKSDLTGQRALARPTMRAADVGRWAGHLELDRRGANPGERKPTCLRSRRRRVRSPGPQPRCRGVRNRHSFPLPGLMPRPANQKERCALMGQDSPLRLGAPPGSRDAADGVCRSRHRSARGPALHEMKTSHARSSPCVPWPSPLTRLGDTGRALAPRHGQGVSVRLEQS